MSSTTINLIDISDEKKIDLNLNLHITEMNTGRAKYAEELNTIACNLSGDYENWTSIQCMLTRLADLIGGNEE